LAVRRPIEALQVEVTSRCTRVCRVCPRSGLSNDWQDRTLSPAAWAAILPALPQVAHVHLQGWGEPLLDPALPQRVSDAKRSGCTVGITTNGDLLASAAGWLAKSGIDVVTVSVAGHARHPALRGGSPIEDVLAAVASLAGRGHRRRRVRVQVSFLLTRSNLHELEPVVEAAARAGAAELYVTRLDATTEADLFEESGLDDEAFAAQVREEVRRAAAAARRAGIVFRGPATEARDMLTCDLDPGRFAFVSADGRVGPCVYLLLPVRGALRRAVGPTESIDIAPVVFGTVPGQSLVEILEGPARQAFIAPFLARLASERAFAAALGHEVGAAALDELAAADRRRTDALRDAPMPAACAGCHKARGY